MKRVDFPPHMTLEPLGLPRATGRDALVRLERAGHVVADGELVRFTDPLLGRWGATAGRGRSEPSFSSDSG